jgi:hypothetical protein
MADLVITAANVLKGSGASLGSGIAGETITAGQALYLKAADSRLWKAQCDGTTEEAAVVGIALHGATAGQPLSYQASGTMNIGGTTVKTTVYVLSATAGGVAPLADLIATNKIVHLGYATATDGTFVVKITNTGAAV